MNRHKSEVLFIGGPLDSQIRVLDERHADYRFLQITPECEDTVFVYILGEISSGTCKWRIGRPKDMEDEEMMQTILDWYAGGRLEPRCNLPKGE